MRGTHVPEFEMIADRAGMTLPLWEATQHHPPALLSQLQQEHLSEGLGLTPGSSREHSGPRVLEQFNDLLRSSLLSRYSNTVMLNPTLGAPSVEPTQECEKRTLLGLR